MPAPPPATRFVAAEAGFLPPGPFVDFTDMILSLTRLLFLFVKDFREGKAGWVVSWYMQRSPRMDVSSSLIKCFAFLRSLVS